MEEQRITSPDNSQGPAENQASDPQETPGRPSSEDSRRTKNPILRTIRICLGWTLIFLGFLGLFLPILQGILMLAAGTALLYKESPFLARQIDRLKPYYRVYRMKFNAWRAKRKRKRIN